MISCDAFARWFKGVEELGGTVPERITGHLASMEAFRQAIQEAARGHAASEVMKAIKDRRGDKPMSVDAAYDLLEALGNSALVTHYARDLMDIDYPLATLIRDDLRGAAGDDLVGSLRGRASDAIRGIQRAGEFFGGDVTPEQVIARGPDAVVAYQEAEGHGQYLDQLLYQAFRPMGQQLELIPPELITDMGLGLLGVWFLDPSSGYLLEDVGRLLMSPSTQFSVPGSRWLKVMSLTGLQFNSPSQVISILKPIQDQRRQDLLGERDLTYDERDLREANAEREMADAIGYQEVS